jgi:hypothetical protein
VLAVDPAQAPVDADASVADWAGVIDPLGVDPAHAATATATATSIAHERREDIGWSIASGR